MSDEIIVSTKDRPGSYDAIETAKPNEPLFPIQGGDPFGPPTVLHWAHLARAEGLRLTNEHPENSRDHAQGMKLLGKATDAEQVAWAMQSYQRGEIKDDPADGRASYSGHSIELDEDADHSRKVREARIKGAAVLNDIVGRGVDLADILAGLETCPTEVAELRDALETIRLISIEVEPRRGNERS